MSKVRRAFASGAELLAFDEAAKAAMGLPRAGTDRWVEPGTGVINPDTGEALDPLTVGVARMDRPNGLTAALVRADMLTANELAELASAYDAWAVGTVYEVGDVREHAGLLYKCVQAHTSQVDWAPPNVPALWTPAAPANVIPEWVQPTGAHDAYSIGDMVTFQGSVYRSLINGNVWSPIAYPAGWELVP